MKIRNILLIGLFAPSILVAQTTKESVEPLSKQASKGILDAFRLTDDGMISASYKMKVDKKSDELKYEYYTFDQDLNFKGNAPEKVSKVTKPNQTISSITAFVGGGNSFNVLSMKLNLQKEVWERNWDFNRQAYSWGKRLSKEVVKPRNSDGKYKGFASFTDDDTGNLMVIASAETDKDNGQFLLLFVDPDLNLKETLFPVKGNYSLMYCSKLENGNVFAVLAPNKGMGEADKYVYVEFGSKGELKTNTNFKSPANAMIIMDHKEQNGALYFCAGSLKKSDFYDSSFENYAPIYNPGYSTSMNLMMDKYEKKLYNAEFANFHLLKFQDGKIVFSSSTPIESFKTKIVTPLGQKKGTPYEGKKMVIDNFLVTPDGEYLIAGQLEDRKIINAGKSVGWFYYDIIGLHFDKSGNLKAQYVIDKMNSDKKSESFRSNQNFFMSEDGKSAYWEILEVKGTKGYADFIDAFNGDATVIPNYFPRINKINLSDSKIADSKVLGENGKYLLYKSQSFMYNEQTRTRFYFGHDEDYKKIWIGKFVMK